MPMVRVSNGGTLKETVLYSKNKSGFNALTANLNDDIDNYDYLKIKYIDHVDSLKEFEVIFPISFVKQSIPQGNHCPIMAFGSYDGGAYCVRFVQYSSNTSLYFRDAVNSSNGISAGSNCVMYEIDGLK